MKSASKPAAGLSNTMFNLPPYCGWPKVAGFVVLLTVVGLVVIGVDTFVVVEVGAIVEVEVVAGGWIVPEVVVVFEHDDSTKATVIKQAANHHDILPFTLLSLFTYLDWWLIFS